MPRRLVTPHDLELSHADAPGWLIRSKLAPSALLGEQPRAIRVQMRFDDLITPGAARTLATMLTAAADFADGLDS